MKSRRMTKISIFGSKKDMRKVIDELHSMKSCHIMDHKPDEIDIGGPLENSANVSEAIVTAKSLISAWKLDDSIKKQDVNLGSSIKKLNNLQEQSRIFYDEIKKAEDEINFLTAQEKTLSILEKLNIDPSYISDVSKVKISVGRIRDIKSLEADFSAVSDQYDYKLWQDDQNKIYLSLVYNSNFENKYKQILQSRGFQEINLDDLKYSNRSKINDIKKKLEATIKKFKSEQDKLVKVNESFLVSALKKLMEESEKSDAPLRFAVTENTFYLEGYVPKNDYEKIRNKLEKITNKKIDVNELKITNQDEIPIELHNPKPTEPYQFFMDLYSYPKYWEIDPTILTFISFPILFGFMLGDMGYGLITLLLFLIIKMKTEKGTAFRTLADILVFASLWTIIFGALFGEVFGAEIVAGYDLPRILSRLHDINDLLMLSLIVGVIHVNLGLIVGFYNEYKHHGLKTAVFEKLGWVVLQIAAVLIGLASMKKTIPIYFGFIVLGIAIWMIFKGEGVRGLVELPSIFSNILSYLRLMAIGLASAGLVTVVNDMSFELFRAGIGGIIGGVCILVLGHVINILLGLIGPFLHSLRLHYVEFFTKFFKGGGKHFVPFGINNGGR